MRSFIFAMPAICLAFSMSAQTSETDVPMPKPAKVRKNEIGLLLEAPSRDALYGNASGVQFKRWVRPNFGYSISATTSSYSFASNLHLLDVKGDTTRYSQTNTYVPLHYLGWGVQIQRQFFGKIHLYAALESRIAYGKGHIEQVEITEVSMVRDSFRHYSGTTIPQSKEDLSILTVDFSPLIGARIPFKRFCLGAEITAVRAGAVHYTFGNRPGYDLAIAEVNELRQRLYLSFRF